MAERPSPGMPELRRACARNRASAVFAAHCGGSPPYRTREPHAIPRAASLAGNARARTEAACALGGVRGFLGFWNRQRSLCLALVPVVRRTHRSPQAGMGAGLWVVVDDSRTVRPDRFIDGESAPGRRTGLDAAKQVTGTSGERGKVCRTISSG